MDEASREYHKTLRDSPAVEYLKTRGLSGVSAQSFRLGYVASPLPGHEQYAGMLCIPYLTRAGAVTLRFRRIDIDGVEGQGPKYRSLPGDPPRVFNPNAFMRHEPYIAICEGEMDAITATQAGLPAVAIPGVSSWRKWFGRCFKGYAAVFILADTDDKGQGVEFAEKVAADIENARIMPMPQGHDVNSFVRAEGAEALLARLEVDKIAA